MIASISAQTLERRDEREFDALALLVAGLWSSKAALETEPLVEVRPHRTSICSVCQRSSRLYNALAPERS